MLKNFFINIYILKRFYFFKEIPADDILELFGKTFFEFCQDSGYDKILQVLGATPRDFLQNLDALHDHLGTLYPGMRAPSFRCTENNGSLILHYYSERGGLEHIVIGIVKEVASKLHGVDVDIKIVKRKGEPLTKDDHCYLPQKPDNKPKKGPEKSTKKSIVRQKIEEWEEKKDPPPPIKKLTHKDKLIKEIENSYLGDKIENIDNIITNLSILGDTNNFNKLTCDDKIHNNPIIERSDHVQFLITEISGPKTPTQVQENETIEDFDLIADGPLISPATFCRVFPFHIMFNRQMVVVQAGKSVSRVIPR